MMKSQNIQRTSEKLLSLSPLFTLSPEDHRKAASELNTLSQEICDLKSTYFPRPELMKKLIMHLRTIGDPSNAEQLAVCSAEYYETSGQAIPAITMLNFAAMTCFDQNVYQEAAQYFDKAMRLVPLNDPQHQRLSLLINTATMHTELHHFEEAIRIYETTLKMAESAANTLQVAHHGMTSEQIVGLIHNNMGWVLLRNSRANNNDPDLISQSIGRFEKALTGELLPRTRITARGNLAEALIMQSDFDRVIRLLEITEEDCRRLDLLNSLSETYRRRAQLCARQRDLDGFVTWSQKTMRASLSQTNPRQEKRIVEVFIDTLVQLLREEGDKLAVLEDRGAPILELVLSLLRSKDTYTGGDHSKRVARLSGKLANLLLSDKKPSKRTHVRKVVASGLLHDIGKLIIPWSLLNKIGPLTARDRKQLQDHVIRGKEILQLLGLPELAKVIAEHHERPDGIGYPTGARHLTLDGAIVSVADAYESMTSPARIYQNPKSPAEALQEVARCAGTQFDSRVADVLPLAV